MFAHSFLGDKKSGRGFDWWHGCEAAWIAKGAGSKEAALLDVTGNGNHLTYANYDSAGWSNANGWAGLGNPNYFDTGIIPGDSTFYVSFFEVGTESTYIGVTQAIDSLNQRFAVYPTYGGTSGFRYGIQSFNVARVASGVMATNKTGSFLNGIRVGTWTSAVPVFTFSAYLMGLSSNGIFFAAAAMSSGYLQAACISNKPDPDYVVKARSTAMLRILEA